MAYITELKDRERDKPWRARIRRKGHKPIIKLFRTKKAAERWTRVQEDSLEQFGTPLNIEQLKNETLGQEEDKEKGIKDGIVGRYLKEVTPTKGSEDSETSVLKAFLKRDICKISLAEVSMTNIHAVAYRDMRLKEVWYPKGAKKGRKITPRTVRRELNTLSHVFALARAEWGYTNLKNPFEGMEVKGSTFKRN